MKITIPKPCHENWEMMTPEEKGRFCSVCSKTVMDFTVASDAEIVEVFSTSKENICGNFYESQLNRNLQYSYINSLFTKFAVSFILTTGGFVSVNAQENISNDTLKVEEIGDVVIHQAFNKTTNKKMFVGATTIVPEQALKNIPKNKIAEISGKSPGLIINPMPKDSVRGTKIMIGGANSSISGNSDPLVMMNKKIITLAEFRKLDPNSIKSMNILKGESATAIYGEKGKNGVIVVTMKKRFRVKI
jgi:TonB-dependent SusC/RagA subfamily outer membrane receptor